MNAPILVTLACCIACSGSTKTQRVPTESPAPQVASTDAQSVEEEMDAGSVPVAPETAAQGALLQHFLKFEAGDSRTQIEAKLTAAECTWDDKRYVLVCAASGLGLFSKVSYQLYGNKLYSVRVKYAGTFSWDTFVQHEATVLGLLLGLGPFFEGKSTSYEIGAAKERLHTDWGGHMARAVMFVGSRLEERGKFIGKLLAFKHQSEQAYGFELTWIPGEQK